MRRKNIAESIAKNEVEENHILLEIKFILGKENHI